MLKRIHKNKETQFGAGQSWSEWMHSDLLLSSLSSYPRVIFTPWDRWQCQARATEGGTGGLCLMINILQYASQPLTTKRHLAPDVSPKAAEKRYSNLQLPTQSARSYIGSRAWEHGWLLERSSLCWTDMCLLSMFASSTLFLLSGTSKMVGLLLVPCDSIWNIRRCQYVNVRRVSSVSSSLKMKREANTYWSAAISRHQGWHLRSCLHLTAPGGGCFPLLFVA